MRRAADLLCLQWNAIDTRLFYHCEKTAGGKERRNKGGVSESLADGASSERARGRLIPRATFRQAAVQQHVRPPSHPCGGFRRYRGHRGHRDRPTRDTWVLYLSYFPFFFRLGDVRHESWLIFSPPATFLRICHRSDPYLNDCIKRSVESLRPYLKTGIPALNIPPCEPLNVPEIELSQAAGPVTIRSAYSNIRVWGGTDFILKSVKWVVLWYWKLI